MNARDKTSPLIAPSYGEVRDVEVTPSQNDLAAASERFATTLRTASVETGPRESSSARFSGREHLLWTTGFESEWHRHVERTHPSTVH